MHYLHSSIPIVLHRDLKSSNVLVDKHLNHVVICDFGLSILADNRSQSTRKKKTAKVCFNYICVKIFIVIVVAYSF
jgi:serine/threonine protein kinase